MRLPFRPLGQAGFTPLEALLATVAGLLAISAFASFNTAQMYALRTQASQTDLQGTARSIVDLFAREVRRAGTGMNPNCTATTNTGIVSASSSTLRFKADVNNDTNLTGSGEANEDVTYTLDSNNNAVTRTDSNTSSTPATLWSGSTIAGASAIAGSQILYWDSNGTQLAPNGTLTATQLTQVVRIKLELALAGTGTQPGNSTVLTVTDGATVDLRNRYFAMPVCGPQTQTSPMTFYR